VVYCRAIVRPFEKKYKPSCIVRRWLLSPRGNLKLGPEHRVTIGQMIEKLDADAALDASARVNSRENVRLTFDQS
jgi:hypothetical protein